MTAVSDLRAITAALRKACLTRWTDDRIMDHVRIRLPAPIFDRLETELRRELSPIQAQESGVGLYGHGAWMTFDGVKFERLDGTGWSVSAREAMPDASGSYMGTGSAFWNKDHEGR